MRVVALQTYCGWEAHAEPADEEVEGLDDDALAAMIRSTFRVARTKAEAVRLARAAWAALVKPCRGEEHRGRRVLPATPQFFPQDSKRKRDGSRVLRSLCHDCYREQQRLQYIRRKAEKSLDKSIETG